MSLLCTKEASLLGVVLYGRTLSHTQEDYLRVLVCQVYVVAIHSTKADQTLWRGNGPEELVLLCGVHFPQFSTEAGGCTEED